MRKIPSRRAAITGAIVLLVLFAVGFVLHDRLGSGSGGHASVRVEVADPHPRVGELMRFTVVDSGATQERFGSTIDVGEPGHLFPNGLSQPLRLCPGGGTSTGPTTTVPKPRSATYGWRYTTPGTYTLRVTEGVANPCTAPGQMTFHEISARAVIVVRAADPTTATTRPPEVTQPVTVDLQVSNDHPHVGEAVTVTAIEHGGAVAYPAVFGFSDAPGPAVNLPSRPPCGHDATDAERTSTATHTFTEPGTFQVSVFQSAGDPCTHTADQVQSQVTVTVSP